MRANVEDKIAVLKDLMRDMRGMINEGEGDEEMGENEVMEAMEGEGESPPEEDLDLTDIEKGEAGHEAEANGEVMVDGVDEGGAGDEEMVDEDMSKDDFDEYRKSYMKGKPFNKPSVSTSLTLVGVTPKGGKKGGKKGKKGGK